MDVVTSTNSVVSYPKLERRDTASEGVLVPPRPGDVNVVKCVQDGSFSPFGVVSRPGSRPGSGESTRSVGSNGDDSGGMGMRVDVDMSLLRSHSHDGGGPGKTDTPAVGVVANLGLGAQRSWASCDNLRNLAELGKFKDQTTATRLQAHRGSVMDGEGGMSGDSMDTMTDAEEEEGKRGNWGLMYNVGYIEEEPGGESVLGVKRGGGAGGEERGGEGKRRRM